jgi:hypothetical protein
MKELIAIQSTLNAPKGQYNAFGKYKYRSCEDILGAVKPLLNKFGCTLTISDDVVMVGTRIYIKATATITNSAGEKEVTTAYAREEEQKKGMDGSQVTGAASSYARKYALNGLFAIDDTKDADTLNTSVQYTQQPAQPSAQQDYDPGEILEAYAKPAIEQACTKEDLARIYNDFTVLHGNSDFLTALTAQRKKLGIKNSNEK